MDKVLFVSATEKQRILKIMDEAMNVYKRMKFRVSTGSLNRYLLEIISITPPPSVKGKYVKIMQFYTFFWPMDKLA